METWARICSVAATVALLVGSGAGFAALSLDQDRVTKYKGLLRTGLLLGVGALLLRVILRSIAALTRSSSDWLPFSSAGDRAALIALVAGLLTVSTALRNLGRPRPGSDEWAELFPLAIVAALSVPDWPAKSLPAPILLVFTLIAAGLGLWAMGQGLNALAKNSEASRWLPVIPCVGIAVNVVVVGGVNWRVWGTPGGTAAASQGGFLVLFAVWLISAAGLILGQSSVRLARTLHFLAVVLLVGTALIVQWTLPFS